MLTTQEKLLRLTGTILVVGAVTVSNHIKPTQMSLASTSVTAASPQTPSQTADILAEFSMGTPPRFIAHAGGMYQGMVYTNSIAALEHSHQIGYRLQEVDLNITTDNQIILLHDWSTNLTNVFGLEPGQRDLQTIVQATAGGNYHIATLDDLAKWVSAHPTADIILDTKYQTVPTLSRIAERYPRLRNQFVPYIYDLASYEPVKTLGFKHISLLVRPDEIAPTDLLVFANTHALHSIAMQPATLATQLPALSQTNRIYIWTINDPAALKPLANQGAYGLITDTLNDFAKPSL